MDQQNRNKIKRLSCMDNRDLRSNQLRQKFRSLGHQSTVTDGVTNRFGFKYLGNRETSKENKEPLAEESQMKLQKKNNPSRRPTFKVGIPHHRYWSPTARDTPISHFHGLNKKLKFRRTFSKRLSQASITEKSNQELSVECPDMNDLKQEEATQEISKEDHPIDKLEKKDNTIEESNISNVACTNMNDLNQEETPQEVLNEKDPIDELEKDTDIMKSDTLNVTRTIINDLNEEEIPQEILEDKNPIDELKKKDTDIMKSNTSNDDSLDLDDSKNLPNLLKIVTAIILYYYLSSFFK